MIQRDIVSNVKAVLALKAVSRAASAFGEVIDLQGYNSAMIALVVGQANYGDWSFVLRECDTSNGTFTAVAASDLQGSFPDDVQGTDSPDTGEDAAYQVGYIGSKQYIRLDVHPAESGGSPASSLVAGAVAILGVPDQRPVSTG